MTRHVMKLISVRCLVAYLPASVRPCTKASQPCTVSLGREHGKDAVQVATSRARSLAYVMLNWGLIVAMFLASDYVYLANFPHWQCSAILAALFAANFKAFDNTRQVSRVGAGL